MSVEVSLDKPTGPLIGEVLANRYQIEAKIGEGAMGAVYRAKHVKVGRAFAVKVLHPRLLLDAKVLQRFEREAELAGRLRHPNVIGVVDVGETTDGMSYMVMDFAAGPDLATLLSDAPFTPQRLINLTRQMLEGLFHAHEQGLIHRDFKPENVIVEKDSHGNEVPRIVDFGIAILREGGDSTDGPGRLTTNGLVLGTPHYMAPEQAVADPIDHRIDLFALGIMVYEMLSGKLPFDGSGAEVARANLLLDPPPIAERVPYLAVDPLLEAFARRLMEKKRDRRPANAKVARDLLNLIESDRLKAAAALGVPLDLARAPATTQDAAPPLRHHSGPETFPPPIRAAQAPAMTAPKAVAAASPEPHLTTQQTEPKTRRAPLIAAAVAGFGVLGAAAFVMMSGGEEPKRDDKIAIAPEPAPAPNTETTPPVETPPEKPVEVGPHVEVPAVEAKVEDKVEPNVEDKVEPAPKSTPPKITKTAKVPPKTVKTPATTTQTTNPQTSNTTNATPPIEPKPAEPKVVTADMLAKQYQAVGSQLRALSEAKGQDAVSDLWSRYRMIRLSDALSNQTKRDDAAAILSKLATEAAARKK